jgi:serine/threonine protein kinase
MEPRSIQVRSESRFKNVEDSAAAHQQVSVSTFLDRIQGTLKLLSSHFDLRVEQWITYNYPIVVCKVSVHGNLVGTSNPTADGRTFLCAKFGLCSTALRKEAEILSHLEESCNENCQFFPRVVLFTTFNETDGGNADTYDEDIGGQQQFPSPHRRLQTSVLLTEWIGSGVPLRKALTDAPCWNTAVQRMAVQLLFVLLYLRRAGVVSRDIKPSNLLWDGEFRALYICDFDLGEIKPSAGDAMESGGTGKTTSKQPMDTSAAGVPGGIRFFTAGTPGFIRPRRLRSGNSSSSSNATVVTRAALSDARKGDASSSQVQKVPREIREEGGSELDEANEMFQELFKDDLFSGAVTLLAITAGIRETDVPDLRVRDMLANAVSQFRDEVVALHFSDLIRSMLTMSGYPDQDTGKDSALPSLSPPLPSPPDRCDLTLLLQHPFFSVPSQMCHRK